MPDRVVCCEHNQCPQRPTLFVRRFRTRPWRCPQCGLSWVGVWVSAWDTGFWSWKETTDA